MKKAHVMANMVTTIQETAERVEKRMNNTDVMEHDLAVLSGSEAGGDPLSAFYAGLRTIREVHRDAEPVVLDALGGVEAAEVDYSSIRIPFSGEERNGRYLDLVALHGVYLNVKAIPNKAMQYGEFLDVLSSSLLSVPVAAKIGDKEYKGYVAQLEAYLLDFLARIDPLRDLDAFKADIEGEKATLWRADALPGSLKGVRGTYSELNDLYCAPCDKILAKASLLEPHLGGKKHKRALKRYHALSEEERDADPPSLVAAAEMAGMELRIADLVSLLGPVVEATKANVERKQARTADELVADMEMSDDDAESDASSLSHSDDEGGAPVAPAHVPLGPDGNPMPRWLFLLQGLDQYFDCEICGNKQYRGRLEFDQHFGKWQHEHGMRCLGIPNTKAFFGITKIEDARALWAKVSAAGGPSSSSTSTSMEDGGGGWEDEEVVGPGGNVMTRKTYELMKRNGMF